MNQTKEIIHNPLGKHLSAMLLRIWLGMRAVQAGVEKFAGKDLTEVPSIIDGKPNDSGLMEVVEVKVYSWNAYKGIPEALSGKFYREPLLPDFSLIIYNWILGPAFIILGMALLLGIASRLSLFAMGLLYTSLTFGLILLNQSSGIAWLGVHLFLIVMMLNLADYNRYELGNLLADRLKLSFLKQK
ncbi:MAG: hypothetical protein AAFX93_08935 [Verrucomicrobiota bacterium]